MTESQLAQIEIALQLAYEAGKWAGQVELEEHYERELLSKSLLSVHYSHKTAMPIDLNSSLNTRRVEVILRSKPWRKGVRASAKAYLEKAKSLIITFNQ